jgi:hypothetical protein
VIAHVAGLPVEELLPVLGGASALLVFARGWISLRVGRRKRKEA